MTSLPKIGSLALLTQLLLTPIIVMHLFLGPQASCKQSPSLQSIERPDIRRVKQAPQVFRRTRGTCTLLSAAHPPGICFSDLIMLPNALRVEIYSMGSYAKWPAV